MGGSESVSIYDLLYIEFIKVKRGISNHHSFQCLLALVVGVWSGGIALVCWPGALTEDAGARLGSRGLSGNNNSSQSSPIEELTTSRVTTRNRSAILQCYPGGLGS